MTCAGLLGLAVSLEGLAEAARARGPTAKVPGDIGKDRGIRLGLMALGAVVDLPVELYRKRGREAAVPKAGGNDYYFLWSLERTCVSLGLQTLGKKDWYAWGAEILLANQLPDGTWRGDYHRGGADTCLALLFLRRSNLVRDLTAYVGGRVQDPGAAIVKAGTGLRTTVLKGKLDKRLYAEGEPTPVTKELEKSEPEPARVPVEVSKGLPKPAPSAGGTGASPVGSPVAEGPTVAQLADDLARTPADRQGLLLQKLRDGRGVTFTEALATAIPKLSGEARRRAREALADRLTRMKAQTLGRYLEDEDAEIRRAAALACAMKDCQDHLPGLIRLLGDREVLVARAAHAALKELSGQDLGPRAGADGTERDRAIAAWRAWWKGQN
jgi:hypothetical protein